MGSRVCVDMCERRFVHSKRSGIFFSLSLQEI